MRYNADDKTATKIHMIYEPTGCRFMIKLFLTEAKMVLNKEESFDSLSKKFGLKPFTWKNRVLTTLNNLARYYNRTGIGFAGDYKKRPEQWFELIEMYENNKPQVIIDSRPLRDLKVSEFIEILDKYYNK